MSNIEDSLDLFCMKIVELVYTTETILPSGSEPILEIKVNRKLYSKLNYAIMAFPDSLDYSRGIREIRIRGILITQGDV